MLLAGVVLDAWKIDFFKKHLDQAGYTYEQKPGISADTLTLMIHTHTVTELEKVVRAANMEAASSKGNHAQH